MRGVGSLLRQVPALNWVAACLFAATLLFARTGMGASPVPVSAQAKQGQAIFQKRCVVCHNKAPGDNAPFGPPNLYTVFHNGQITTKEAETIIKNGRGQMPAWGAILTQSDIDHVIAYLRTAEPRQQ